MRDGWVTKPIGEIADACLGKMLDKNKNKGTLKPYLRNLNVRWFNFYLSDVLEMRFEDNEQERYTARRGDLLICEGGYPGRAAIWEDDEPIYFQKAIHRVRFHEPERAKWFLYYLYFCDIDGSLRSHFTGAGIQHFTGEALKRFRIPLPPLPEQQRIVAILDAAFTGLATANANAEKNLKNARELFESYLNSVFAAKGRGWIRCQIGDVATTQYGLSGTLNSEGKGYKIFRMGEVQDGRLVDTGRMKSIDIKHDEFEQYRLRRGDVLFNRTNSSDLVGKTGLFNLDGDYCFASYLVRVNYDPSKMNSTFAAYLMNSSQFLARVRAKAARSVNQANINATILRNEIIDFPESVSVQKSLVAKFDALSAETERLEQSYTAKAVRLAQLKQSILQKAFSGELTSPPSQAIREAAE